MNNDMNLKSKNKNFSEALVLKTSIWYTISNFLTRALVFITTPIFSRLLTTKEFGEFHVFANWQGTLIIIASLEIHATLNRARFDYGDKEELNSYISSCLIVSTIITGVLFLGYLAFSDAVERILLMDKSYIMIMFAYLFTRPAFEMFQIEQRVHYRYKLSAVISFVMIIFTSLLALFLAYKMHEERLYGRIIGQYIPYAILGGIIYIYYIWRNHKLSLDKAKYAVKMAIPLVFSYLGGQILLVSDKIIVQHLSTAEAVAYLGIATTCSHIILIFVQSLNNAWSPWFYDKLALGENESIKKTFRIYLYFVIFCTFGVLLIGPEIVFILGGKEYEPSIFLLPACLLSGPFTLLVSQFGAFENFYKKTHYSAIITSITACINVVLDIVGVRIWGYVAVCYVTVLCHIILIILHICLTKKMGILYIFPFSELMFEILVIVGMIPIVLLLYKNNLMRYLVLLIILGIFAVILYKNRGKLIILIKEKL